MPIETIQLPEKEIIIVGTAHVSQNSVKEVQEAIAHYQPDLVSVELCPSRYEIMKNPRLWYEMDIFKVIRENKTTLLFINLLMASFQRRIGARLGVRPGEEMQAAIDAAESSQIPVATIDRSIQLTLQRAWHGLSLKEKVVLLFSSLYSIMGAEDISEADVERMKDQDVLSAALEEVSLRAPAVKRVVLDERDTYMAGKLMALDGSRVLAVVGAGHMRGIAAHLQEGLPVDINALEMIPRKRKLPWGWILAVLVVLLFILGFFMGGMHQGIEMLKWWIICKSSFAALGALVSFAHPLTILTAAAVAPFTTWNPVVRSAWFTGLSEAYLRRPKVKNFETLSDDIMTFKGFWTNPITHILLVCFFTTLGSAIGAVLAMPVLTRIMMKAG